MDKFKISTSYKRNVMKTIRFPENLNHKICKTIEHANKGVKIKHYSFNSFVCSACEFALEHLADEFKYKEENSI